MIEEDEEPIIECTSTKEDIEQGIYKCTIKLPPILSHIMIEKEILEDEDD